MVTGTGLCVRVRRDICAGSGNCVRTAPEVFDQDDDEGLVILVTPEPAQRDHDAVRQAAELCPVGAIEIVD